MVPLGDVALGLRRVQAPRVRRGPLQALLSHLRLDVLQRSRDIQTLLLGLMRDESYQRRSRTLEKLTDDEATSPMFTLFILNSVI